MSFALDGYGRKFHIDFTGKVPCRPWLSSLTGLGLGGQAVFRREEAINYVVATIQATESAALGSRGPKRPAGFHLAVQQS